MLASGVDNHTASAAPDCKKIISVLEEALRSRERWVYNSKFRMNQHENLEFIARDEWVYEQCHTGKNARSTTCKKIAERIEAAHREVLRNQKVARNFELLIKLTNRKLKQARKGDCKPDMTKPEFEDAPPPVNIIDDLLDALDKPAPDKPAADKPAPDKPAPDKPAADKPAANKPAADKADAGGKQPGTTPVTRRQPDVSGSGISEADALAICKRKLKTNRARVRRRNGEWRCYLPLANAHERDARKTCREKYGRFSLPNLSKSSYKTYVCYCISGWRWNEGKTFCIRDKKPTAGTGAGAGAAGGQPSGAGSGGSGPGSGGSGSGSGGGRAGCVMAKQYTVDGYLAQSPSAEYPGCVDEEAGTGLPCPASPGWILPIGTTCGSGPVGPAGPVTASGGGAPNQDSSGGDGGAPSQASPGSAASAPRSSAPPDSGFGSGCGPMPNCAGQGTNCKPVNYTCRNNEWMGGHCVCDGF